MGALARLEVDDLPAALAIPVYRIDPAPDPGGRGYTELERDLHVERGSLGVAGLQERLPAACGTVRGGGVLVRGPVVEIGLQVVEGNQAPVVQLDAAM